MTVLYFAVTSESEGRKLENKKDKLGDWEGGWRQEMWCLFFSVCLCDSLFKLHRSGVFVPFMPEI